MFDPLDVTPDIQHGRPYPVDCVVPTFLTGESVIFALARRMVQTEAPAGERVKVRIVEHDTVFDTGWLDWGRDFAA